jgi:hypothetical protein
MRLQQRAQAGQGRKENFGKTKGTKAGKKWQATEAGKKRQTAMQAQSTTQSTTNPLENGTNKS